MSKKIHSIQELPGVFRQMTEGRHNEESLVILVRRLEDKVDMLAGALSEAAGGEVKAMKLKPAVERKKNGKGEVGALLLDLLADGKAHATFSLFQQALEAKRTAVPPTEQSISQALGVLARQGKAIMLRRGVWQKNAAA